MFNERWKTKFSWGFTFATILEQSQYARLYGDCNQGHACQQQSCWCALHIPATGGLDLSSVWWNHRIVSQTDKEDSCNNIVQNNCRHPSHGMHFVSWKSDLCSWLVVDARWTGSFCKKITYKNSSKANHVAASGYIWITFYTWIAHCVCRFRLHMR